MLISYSHKPNCVREISGVTLADIEDATRVKKGNAIFAQVCNVLWRSPEA